jgi:hypothetical protein
MGVAIADAKAGHDDDAFVITRSTQLHNSEAVGVLNAAGVKKVADYLRTK